MFLMNLTHDLIIPFNKLFIIIAIVIPLDICPIILNSKEFSMFKQILEIIENTMASA